jgi:hypothetical protein
MVLLHTVMVLVAIKSLRQSQEHYPNSHVSCHQVYRRRRANSVAMCRRIDVYSAYIIAAAAAFEGEEGHVGHVGTRLHV